MVKCMDKQGRSWGIVYSVAKCNYWKMLLFLESFWCRKPAWLLVMSGYGLRADYLTTDSGSDLRLSLCCVPLQPFAVINFREAPWRFTGNMRAKAFLAAWCILMENALSYSHFCLSGEITYAVYSWYGTIRLISVQILCGKPLK